MTNVEFGDLVGQLHTFEARLVTIERRWMAFEQEIELLRRELLRREPLRPKLYGPGEL